MDCRWLLLERCATVKYWWRRNELWGSWSWNGVRVRAVAKSVRFALRSPLDHNIKRVRFLLVTVVGRPSIKLDSTLRGAQVDCRLVDEFISLFCRRSPPVGAGAAVVNHSHRRSPSREQRRPEASVPGRVRVRSGPRQSALPQLYVVRIHYLSI